MEAVPSPVPAAQVQEEAVKAKAKAKAKPVEAAPVASPPSPEPVPGAKAKAKAKTSVVPEASATDGKAEAKAKAKASAKAPDTAPKAEPNAKAKESTAEPTPKAKGKKSKNPDAAEAEPNGKAKPSTAEPTPKANESRPKASKAKDAPSAAPPPTAAKVEPKVTPKVVEPEVPIDFDDGAGGDWENVAGLSKKASKRKEKLDQLALEQAKAEADAAAKRAEEAEAKAALAAAAAIAAAKAEKKKAKAQPVTESPAAAEAPGTPAAPAAQEQEPAAQEQEKPESNMSTCTIKVPHEKVGAVIGHRGSRIKLIQEKTGVSRIDVAGEVFTVTGLPETVLLAEQAIKEIIEKGYLSLAFEDFSEDGVMLHPSVFPDLIGSKGAIVRRIKEELAVEINIPSVPDQPKNGSLAKKYKVSVAGSAPSVSKALVVINNIATYSHDELTHPGQVHAEMEIEEHKRRFVIGRQGSEMRHIQNNYKVKVNIPREHSLCPNVLIVGEADQVAKAKAYIKKVLQNAEQPKGRERNDEGDVWGEEEAEEGWMKAYMVKRN